MKIVASRTDAGRGSASPDEWECRCELAAGYRLLAKFGMSDNVDGFIGNRIRSEPGAFLVKRYDAFPEEVRASDLVKVSLDGAVIEPRDARVNDASVSVCGAVFRARQDINCLLHAHVRAANVVGALSGGLLSISQPGFMFYNRLAYSAFEFDADEDYCRRMVADYGGRKAMLLHHHGLQTLGATVAEALYLAHALKSACEVQLAAQMTGAPIDIPSADDCERWARKYEASQLYAYDGSIEWPGWLRALDREDSSWRT